MVTKRPWMGAIFDTSNFRRSILSYKVQGGRRGRDGRRGIGGGRFL